MEAIQHMQRLSRLGGKNVEVGLPHVAADEAQPLDHLRSQRLQALPQRLLRTPLSDPQQPPTACVDLVNDGQEVVGLRSASPVNLVHPNRGDTVELAMLQPPLHEPLHRTIDRLPTGLKGLSRFPPAQPPCPASKKSHHGAGHWTLAAYFLAIARSKCDLHWLADLDLYCQEYQLTGWGDSAHPASTLSLSLHRLCNKKT